MGLLWPTCRTQHFLLTLTWLTSAHRSSLSRSLSKLFLPSSKSRLLPNLVSNWLRVPFNKGQTSLSGFRLHIGLSVLFRRKFLMTVTHLIFFMGVILTQRIGQLNLSDTSMLNEPSILVPLAEPHTYNMRAPESSLESYTCCSRNELVTATPCPFRHSQCSVRQWDNREFSISCILSVSGTCPRESMAWFQKSLFLSLTPWQSSSYSPTPLTPTAVHAAAGWVSPCQVILC